MENNIAVNEKKQRPGLAVTALVLAVGIAVVLGVRSLWTGVIVPRFGFELPALVSDILRLTVIPYGVGLGLCVLLYKLLPKMDKSEYESRPFTAGDIAKGTIVQTGVGMVFAVGLNIFLMMLTGKMPEQPELELYSPFMAFILLIFNPVFEELLFRKLSVDRLRRFGKYPAVIISAILFALPHVISQGPRAAAMTFIAGLVWGYVYYRTDNLLPCVIMHSLFNILFGYLSAFLTGRGGIFMGVYFLIYLVIMPVCAVIILAKNGKKIFARD